MKENVQLMRDAKATLQGKWGYAALGTLVYVIIASIISVISCIPFIGWIAPLLLLGALELGYTFFVISFKGEKDDMKIETIFAGFQDFGRALIASLLVVVIVSIGCILLVVPGIILSFGLSMTFFIIAEDKTISGYDAIKKSWNMMKGYKWKYFCLSLRFLGWALLATITFGIGFFWLVPYMKSAYYNFYLDIKDNTAINPENQTTAEISE